MRAVLMGTLTPPGLHTGVQAGVWVHPVMVVDGMMGIDPFDPLSDPYTLRSLRMETKRSGPRLVDPA